MRLLMIRTIVAFLFPMSCALLTFGPAHAGQTKNTTIAGKLFGKEFSPDAVELENRQLTIRQGNSFAPTITLSISIFEIGKGDIPEGKTYSIDTGSRDEHNLLVSAEWQGDGDNREYKMISHGYRLKLSFGREETKGLLPGHIVFSLPGSPETMLSGAFVAGIKGFRIINGKVDLTSDAHATLDEVALQYLRKKHPGTEVRIAEQRDSMLATTATQQKWGFKDLAVTVAGKPADRLKLLFTKQSREWAVFSELSPQQFPHAHPVYPPDEHDYSEMTAFVAAQKGEKDFITAFPGKGVHGVVADCIYGEDDGFTGAALKYKVEGSEEEQERTFIVHLNNGRWEVIREVDGQAMIGKEIAREKMKLMLPKPCDMCRVKGVLSYDGKEISAATSVRPKFWFRSEQKRIEVLPNVEYENGRFTISGLPPGDYGMSVDIDANPANPITYPGDYQTFERFTVTDGNSTLPDVILAKVIHLTAPRDNGGLMERSGEDCSGSLSFSAPVVFSWEPLGEGVSYDYQVYRANCDTMLATVVKGTTTETSLSLQLPQNTTGEYYRFDLHARRNDTFIGLLTTHDNNGYGWDYRFRVR